VTKDLPLGTLISNTNAGIAHAIANRITLDVAGRDIAAESLANSHLEVDQTFRARICPTMRAAVELGALDL
jgi:hypothetical protein